MIKRQAARRIAYTPSELQKVIGKCGSRIIDPVRLACLIRLAYLNLNLSDLEDKSTFRRQVFPNNPADAAKAFPK